MFIKGEKWPKKWRKINFLYLDVNHKSKLPKSLLNNRKMTNLASMLVWEECKDQKQILSGNGATVFQEVEKN